MIEAKIIKDSISELGHRLISIQTIAPKFLDAEIEKHRMISSNSSSSRAIPSDKLLHRDPFIPVDIRKNQKGMQGYEQADEEDVRLFYSDLFRLHSEIVKLVNTWKGRIHKQHLNRYLEPFTLQYKIMTANYEQWMYFLSLRDAEDADPNIQILAKEIRKAIEESEPEELKWGEWHLPYVNSKDAYFRNISAARCARVSYRTHEGDEPSAIADEKLAKFLIDSKHLTPFEHQATPYSPFSNNKRNMYTKNSHNYSGNFMEWLQYRQQL